MAILAECPYCHRQQSLKNKVCAKCGQSMDKAKANKKVTYWINYRLNGRQVRKAVSSFQGCDSHSLEDARAIEGQWNVSKKENKIKIFNINPETTMTFNDLTKWYLGLEKVKTLSSYKEGILQIYLNKFNTEFGTIILNNLKPVDLENLQAKRKREGLSDATIDLEIGTAKTMVFKAFDNDLISGDIIKTFKRVKKLLKGNANARDKVLTPKQFNALLDNSSRHLQGILSTAYHTGMREGEILGLTWDKVDLKNKVIQLEAMDTKDKEPRNIPIVDELYNVLKAVPRAIHDPHVFLYNGKPISDLRTGLRKACKAAGISYGRLLKDGFVFHDLRHTFNTNMRKAGVPESVIMKVTGHSTREMFDRYNRVDLEDAKQGIEQMQAYLKSVEQTVEYAKKIGPAETGPEGISS